MSEQEKEILEKLEKNFPGGSVAVQDVSGRSDFSLLTSIMLTAVSARRLRDLLCHLGGERPLQGPESHQAASAGQQSARR